MPLSAALLPAAPRSLLAASLPWLERHRDETGLFRAPGDEAGRLRESVWLAVGLLLRDEAGDRVAASALLERALAGQLRREGARWHGTFRRTEQEPTPGDDAREWTDYDPNWRQFIGTAFALVLREFEGALPPGLADRLRASIALARGSEPPDRIDAVYTNIALMHAWLGAEAGDARGLALARAVAERFDRTRSFDEYGSPTYYGIDLYALALWQHYAASEELRGLGTRIAATLWRDIARFYHAGLRNLAGPYSRAYGMDLTRYASTLGLWIGAGLGWDHAPFPDPARPFDHSHDFALAPVVALLAGRLPEVIPADVRRHFQAFQGERLVEQRLGGERVASAWLEDELAIGAERGGGDRRGWPQYHPATLHWRVREARDAWPDGVGWLRLRHDGRVEARASRRQLDLVLHAPEDRAGHGSHFEIGLPPTAPGAASTPSLPADCLTASGWRLPGLTISPTGDLGDARFEVDAAGARVRLPGEGGTRTLSLEVAPP